MKYGIKIKYYVENRKTGDCGNDLTKLKYYDTKDECERFLLHFGEGTKKYNRIVLSHHIFKHTELEDFI